MDRYDSRGAALDPGEARGEEMVRDLKAKVFAGREIKMLAAGRGEKSGIL
jgi:hypothetical protein